MAETYQNARVYWELYGGIPPVGWEQQVQAFDMVLRVGGRRAHAYPYFDFALYGRANVNSPNLITFHRETVEVPENTHWRTVTISKTVTHPDVRCLVLKVEANQQDISDAEDPVGTQLHYEDQYDSADDPPWGVRVKSVATYCSTLGRNVAAHRVLRHILEGAGFSYAGPSADWQPDQLAFSEIPKDRWEALDDINGMLGWDYFCWEGKEVEFSVPGTGDEVALAADDPRTSWRIEENLDEVYNAVRVQFTNAKGKPREVVVEATGSDIPIVRADVLTAPDSVKSKVGATNFGARYLRDHCKVQASGSVSVTGFNPTTDTVDPMTIRPGNLLSMSAGASGSAHGIGGTQEVTRVTLRPLDWTAEVQFGANSKRFDAWLARLAVGAKSIKRR
jgi:hypothetical protein